MTFWRILHISPLLVLLISWLSTACKKNKQHQDRNKEPPFSLLSQYLIKTIQQHEILTGVKEIPQEF